MVASWLRREERKDGKLVPPANVLVAVAGNGMDDDLVRMACNLSKKNKGHVIVINVREIPRTLPLDTVYEESTSERVLDHAMSIAHDNGVEIEAEVVQAREAGPAIVDEACERHCELILLGLVPQSRFGQFDLGKTVPYVLQHAKGRVWVVRDECMMC